MSLIPQLIKIKDKSKINSDSDSALLANNGQTLILWVKVQIGRRPKELVESSNFSACKQFDLVCAFLSSLW